jgi:hypothetical protein
MSKNMLEDWEIAETTKHTGEPRVFEVSYGEMRSDVRGGGK